MLHEIGAVGGTSPPTASYRTHRRSTGVALVVVLWMLALLSVLAVGFVGDARTHLLIARNQYEQAQARALAEAGISLAILGALDLSLFPGWRLDGEVREIAFGKGTIRASIQDEAGKIDLNAAPMALLEGLFRNLGFGDGESLALRDAINRWKADRRAQWSEPGVAAMIRPFRAIEELRSIPGISSEVFARIAPFVTVHSWRASIDPSSAPIEVLLSLPGVQPDQARRFVDQRDTPEAGPTLTGVAPFIGPAHLEAVTVRAEAVTETGITAAREAVVELGGPPGVLFSILAWRAPLAPLRDTSAGVPPSSQKMPDGSASIR